MNIREQATNLINEAKALKHFFNVIDVELNATIETFVTLWEDSQSTNEQLETALNAIEARTEDVCLAHHISQEQLEELMADDPSYTKLTINGILQLRS